MHEKSQIRKPDWHIIYFPLCVVKTLFIVVILVHVEVETSEWTTEVSGLLKCQLNFSSYSTFTVTVEV